MYLSITELHEEIENQILICDDTEDECTALQGQCKDQAECIEKAMRKVTEGTRLSARNLDKYNTAQLKSFVCLLFDELHDSKIVLDTFAASLVNYLDLVTRIGTGTLKPLLTQSEYSVTIDERFAKIDQFIANEQSKQIQFEKFETVCNELKDHISTLESLKSDISCQPSPPPPPPIVDWTNIKFPPLPKVPIPRQDTTIIRNEVRLSQDIQLRKNNVILRGLPVAVQTNDPLSTARSFLEKCGIEHYELCQKDLVSAFYLNRRDGHCTIRMIFSNQWIAGQILELAYQLKSGAELYRGVYLDKDRTDDEMKTHRELVAELRKKREDHPTIRWIIRNGTILNRGPFSKSK